MRNNARIKLEKLKFQGERDNTNENNVRTCKIHIRKNKKKVCILIFKPLQNLLNKEWSVTIRRSRSRRGVLHVSYTNKQ